MRLKVLCPSQKCTILSQGRWACWCRCLHTRICRLSSQNLLLFLRGRHWSSGKKRGTLPTLIWMSDLGQGRLFQKRSRLDAGAHIYVVMHLLVQMFCYGAWWPAWTMSAGGLRESAHTLQITLPSNSEKQASYLARSKPATSIRYRILRTDTQFDVKFDLIFDML